jgi:hypothetical protein
VEAAQAKVEHRAAVVELPALMAAAQVVMLVAQAHQVQQAVAAVGLEYITIPYLHI